MGSYILSTKDEQNAMLEELHMSDMEDLFSDVLEKVKYQKDWKISRGISEMEVMRKMEKMSEKNHVFSHVFRGAGAYSHYIPAIVESVISKEEFVTAYTPYQAEMSQGILQSIFEYQTMICELTGMSVSNASVYDGATAAAEAAAMCIDRKKKKILVSETTNPNVIEVMRTYGYGRDLEICIVPMKDGYTDLEMLQKMLSEDTAGFYVQQPNYYGYLEDYEKMERLVHGAKGKFIMGCNPIALAILKTPGEYGADIAVGEGQPLGMDLGFGGPYLGFMAATKGMMRKLPGRIVGETLDKSGKRAFVLTLQGREQHIRREKASSNVCSNEALCALTASVYMAAMGKEGMKEVARQCAANAHYLQQQLEICGLPGKYQGYYFHEFVTVTPIAAKVILDTLESEGILGGLMLSENEILWCATEKNTKEEIDKMMKIIREVITS